VTLRHLRKQRAMTHVQVAASARINVATYAVIENGRFRASEHQARKIASALGVELADIDEFVDTYDAHKKAPADAA